MLKIALKGVAANRTRLAMTALAVILGVSFVSGSFILSDTLGRTFDNIFEAVFQGTDVVVQSERDGANALPEPIEQSLLPTVEGVEGVKAASGGASLLGVIPVKADGKPLIADGPPQFGFSWDDVEQLNPFEITEGRPPETDREVVVDDATFDDADYAIGDSIEVIADDRGTYTLVGVAEFGGTSDGLAGATAVLYTLPEMQRLAGLEGKLDSISVAADDGVSEDELRDRIAAVLPPGVKATTARDEEAEQSSDLTDQLRPITFGLLGFAFVSMFVAAFIIFNTFSITVAQRARQLALLRAVGASGPQVRRMVLIEALVLGIVASVVGLFCGLGIAWVLTGLFGVLGFELPSTALQFLPRTWIVAVGLGVVVTLLASILPARRASTVPPIAAMRADFALSSGSDSSRAVVGGVVAVLAAAVIGLSFAVNDTLLAVVLLAVGALLLLVGVGGLAIALIRPLASTIGWPARKLGGVPGKLGCENAMRNPRRSAVTAAALMIGLALVAASAIGTSSLNASFSALLGDQFPAGFIVSPTGNSELPFSPEVAAAIKQEPLVGPVGQARSGSFRVQGKDETLTGVNLPDFGELHDPDFVDGDWVDLVPGTLAMRESQAEDLGVSVGSALSLDFAAGPRDFTVVALYDESIFGDYFITLDDYEANYSVQQDVVVFANPAEGADQDAAQRQIEQAIAPFPQVQVQNEQQFKDDLEANLNQLLGLVLVLLLFAIIIAIFGIVNTLALSVFERTREIGLLRAVGLGPRQVRLMVIWESVIVSVIGGLLGLLVGVVLGVVLIQRAGGFLTELSVPIGLLIVFLVLSAIAGVLAAIFPARRAARLNVLRAIAQE
ncbi:MAG: ABC transporter permease [Miltoncostaeaceae bacterium]